MDIYTTPLLTARDTAKHLQMPESTLDTWLKGDSALVHHVPPGRRGWPRVPFVGVIEAHVLRTLRDLGFGMSEIKDIADVVRNEFDDPYALASERIATDGVTLFVELADQTLVNARQQVPIREVIDDHLQFIRWDATGRPRQLQLSQYPDSAQVVIDPRFGWGAPVLEASKTPVAAVVDLWRAGESMEVVAEEFGMSRDVVEGICRAA